MSLGFVLAPVPEFFFREDVVDALKFVFHDLGFVSMVVFAVPVMINAFRRLFFRMM